MVSYDLVILTGGFMSAAARLEFTAYSVSRLTCCFLYVIFMMPSAYTHP